MFRVFSVTAICVLVFATTGKSNGRSLGVNIYGVSYHFLEDNLSRELLNEVNPGLGIRGTWSSAHNNWTVLEAGLYEDTFENTAKYVTVGYHLRLLEGFRMGFNFGLYSSESIRNDEIIIIGVPAVSYQLSFCTVNVVYLPKFRNINPFNTLGTYLTVPLVTGK